MTKQTGLIIYFDGPDGVGKTTQLQLTADALRAEGRTVYTTRTNGGTPIGEMLRAAFLSDNDRPVETDLHIILACHYALMPEVLKRRQNGEIILIDRSPLSIIAYQVHGDGLSPKIGYTAAQELLEEINPDLTLIYTAPDDVLYKRRQLRQQDPDFFEQKTQEYHSKVARGYQEAAHRFSAQVIDAAPDVETVRLNTLKILNHKQL